MDEDMTFQIVATSDIVDLVSMLERREALDVSTRILEVLTERYPEHIDVPRLLGDAVYERKVGSSAQLGGESFDWRAFVDDLRAALDRHGAVNCVTDVVAVSLLADLIQRLDLDPAATGVALVLYLALDRGRGGAGARVPAIAQRPATVLFIGANPSSTERLVLDQEVRELTRRLRSSEHRDAFRLEQEWAARASDLQEYLLRYTPLIVHFSGHGTSAGELLLEDGAGEKRPLTAVAFAELFRILGQHTRCVVLNACYSEPQAKAISEYVDCVVGMTRAILDASAIAFAGGFYRTLGYGRDLQTAFELGCNQIGMNGLPGVDIPKLFPRAGVDPRKVRLIDTSAVAG